MTAFALFNQNGFILQIQSKGELLGDAHGCIRCEADTSSNHHYVSENQIKLRPTLPVLDLTDLSNMPDGSSITVVNEDGDSITVSPSESVSLVDPGQYNVLVTDAWPFQDYSGVIQND